MLRKVADQIDCMGPDQCRVKATKYPLVEASYKVWGVVGGHTFKGEGDLHKAETLLVTNRVPLRFYELLVEACVKVGEQRRIEPSFTVQQMKCMASLALWKQSVACVGAITGLGTEGAREVMHTLYTERYIEMVERNGEIRYELTPKGEVALMFLSDLKSFKRVRQEISGAVASIDWSTWSGSP